MQKTLLFLFLIIGFTVNAQLTNLQACKMLSPFIFKKGFNVKRTVISTSEKKYPGFVIYQLPDTSKGKDAKPTYFQDSTWKKYGSMGTFCIDEKGNIYVIPIPWINVIKNEKKNQNTVYKVDGLTGLMSPFVQLPINKKYNPENAFGLLGLTYDCSTKCLYVSTVSASNRLNEKGIIYAIDTKGKKAVVIDSLVGKDALGIGIVGLNGIKVLIVGDARNSNIYSTRIDSTGKFLNKKIEAIFTLENIGSRGDDKAKKFDFANNQINIKAVEFNWNLIAPAEQQQAIYSFKFNTRLSKFELVDMQTNDELQRY